jgi:NADPH-dependent curcumin reductase CurA
MIQTQIVYTRPPADGALPGPAGTFDVVDTPFDTATSLEAGEVLVENLYLSIDPHHRFGLCDPAVTCSQFPVTKPGTIISTYGIAAWCARPTPSTQRATWSTRGCVGRGSRSSANRTSSTCRT